MAAVTGVNATIERGGAAPVEPHEYPHKTVAGGPPCPTCGFRITVKQAEPFKFEDNCPEAEAFETAVPAFLPLRTESERK